MKQKTIWQIWNQSRRYGTVLYKRATGKLPEMESSKAMAKIISKYVKKDTLLGDIGCGAGHYLRSFRKKSGPDFRYYGVDATKNYVYLAKKAHKHDKKCNFQVGDIFSLPFSKSFFDITVCCNVLLHLPKIEKALNELIRISKKKVFIRLLAGKRTFIIRDVFPQKDGYDINKQGIPKRYCFYNIYSCKYLKNILIKNNKVKGYKLKIEKNFNCKKINASRRDHHGAHNTTRTLAGFQVNGYILQPWMVLEIDLKQETKK